MSKRVVVACFGDEQSARCIQRLAATREVVAVAMDFGGAVTLGAMRDLALASGAVRCHALDVREDFAREALLPARAPTRSLLRYSGCRSLPRPSPGRSSRKWRNSNTPTCARPIAC